MEEETVVYLKLIGNLSPLDDLFFGYPPKKLSFGTEQHFHLELCCLKSSQS